MIYFLFLIFKLFSKKEDFSHPVGYVVYFARTPIEVKDGEDGEDDTEEVEEIVQSLQHVDPDWVMEHAKQGLTFWGFFFLDTLN